MCKIRDTMWGKQARNNTSSPNVPKEILKSTYKSTKGLGLRNTAAVMYLFLETLAFSAKDTRRIMRGRTKLKVEDTQGNQDDTNIPIVLHKTEIHTTLRQPFQSRGTKNLKYLKIKKR